MIAALLRGLDGAAGVCLSVLPAMLAGCLLGGVLPGSRPGRVLGRLLAPLSRLAGLPSDGADYLSLCLFSHNAANAFLARRLDATAPRSRARLLGIYLLGWLPASCHYYALYFAPVLLKGLGAGIGGLVLGLYLLASLGIAGIGLAVCRVVDGRSGWRGDRAAASPPGPDCRDGGRAAAPRPVSDEADRRPGQGGPRGGLARGLGDFKSMALAFIPSVVIIQLLLALPETRQGIHAAGTLLSRFGAADAAVVVALAALPSALSGFAAALACLDQGLIQPPAAPPIIFLGALSHAVFSAFSFFLPANVAIFGPRRGLWLTVASLTARLPCLGAVWGLALFAARWEAG